MGDVTEWWRVLTSLSPFLIPIASAVVALLIRDLLEPHQWQRYVRKVTASIFAGILVFAGIAGGYILFLQRMGSEDSLLAIIATFVVGLGIIPTTGFAVFLVFRRVEPDLDSYMNSRFVVSFQNGSWPVLSMKVSPECLPEGATSIDGRVAAVRGNIGEFHLSVGGSQGAAWRPERECGVARPHPLLWQIQRPAQELEPSSDSTHGGTAQMAKRRLHASSSPGANDGCHGCTPLMKRPPPPSIPRVHSLDALRPGLLGRSPGRRIEVDGEQVARLATREGRIRFSLGPSAPARRLAASPRGRMRGPVGCE